MKYSRITEYTYPTICHGKMCELEGCTKMGIINKLRIEFPESLRNHCLD